MLPAPTQNCRARPEPSLVYETRCQKGAFPCLLCHELFFSTQQRPYKHKQHPAPAPSLRHSSLAAKVGRHCSSFDHHPLPLCFRAEAELGWSRSDVARYVPWPRLLLSWLSAG